MPDHYVTIEGRSLLAAPGGHPALDFSTTDARSDGRPRVNADE